MSETTTELLVSKYDISEHNHELHPGIMARFVASFRAPVIVGGKFVGGDAGPDGRPTVGEIVSVEQRGDDLYGEVRWLASRPAGHVRMNWATGPGGAASLTSGFMDHWPHRTDWEIEDDEPIDDEEREELLPGVWI